MKNTKNKYGLPWGIQTALYIEYFKSGSHERKIYNIVDENSKIISEDINKSIAKFIVDSVNKQLDITGVKE